MQLVGSCGFWLEQQTVGADLGHDSLIAAILLVEEILHQLIGSFSHYLQGFKHPSWLLGISSINSSSMVQWKMA